MDSKNYPELLLASRRHEAFLLFGSGRLLQTGAHLGLSLRLVVLRIFGIEKDERISF